MLQYHFHIVVNPPNIKYEEYNYLKKIKKNPIIKYEEYNFILFSILKKILKLTNYCHLKMNFKNKNGPR